MVDAFAFEEAPRHDGSAASAGDDAKDEHRASSKSESRRELANEYRRAAAAALAGLPTDESGLKPPSQEVLAALTSPHLPPPTIALPMPMVTGLSYSSTKSYLSSAQVSASETASHEKAHTEDSYHVVAASEEDSPRCREADRDDSKEFKEQLDPSEIVILDLLGAGAQAKVYRAIWWRSFGSSTSAITVAVKRLYGNTGEHASECESLTRRISHPNLVKCFEATTKAPYLIISEYCAGGSLFGRIHDTASPLSWRQRMKILLDVAKGMEYLHTRQPIILHRDLKSCNVLLTKPIMDASMQPTAKVADFGLSRLLKTSQAFMTRCVGTWRWMAPEVFNSNEYDERIDVFSFGILMFEVLACEIPYADKWPLHSQVDPRVGLHINNGFRPDIQRVQTGCPSRVVHLMQKCWAKNPGERPDFTKVQQQLQSKLDLVTLYSQVKQDVSF